MQINATIIQSADYAVIHVERTMFFYCFTSHVYFFFALAKVDNLNLGFDNSYGKQ